MNNMLKNCAAIFGALILSPAAFAQTAGSVSITATLADLGGGPDHWTAVWVTKDDGTFVRNLRLEGEFVGHEHSVADHVGAWFAASGGNAALDGFTSATSNSYAPFTETWNCTDAAGATIPDGAYQLWIEYAENDHSDVTTGLAWTKGPAASTLNPPNQGANFTGMKIVWTPGAAATGPEIVVQQPAKSNLIDGKTKKSFGTVKLGKKVVKTFTIKNTGTAPLKGLALTKNGANAKDFVATAPGVATLAPGATTTFKVTFKPKAKGTRNAAIHIKSNDKDENPFDINLSGQAVK